MKAMILAAGRGERLRPLTDTTPKPLLRVGPKRLIEYHLDNLARAGINDVVVNIAWLGEQIPQTLGNGENYGLSITYSDEGESALETAGGIIKALPILGDEPFLVVNGDIWTDLDFSTFIQRKLDTEAHLLLVDSPEHNPEGDFALENDFLRDDGEPMLTYSGIGIYTKNFFKGAAHGKVALAPIIREKLKTDAVSGEYYTGKWTDVGTAQRLRQLDMQLTVD